MNRPRLQKIEIQGFRSFGTIPQSFELPSTVAVLWGANSQGKTSMAEAMEFLLTGNIARRELLASTKEEFSDSLRNVHMPDGAMVFIAADVLCPDGKIRRLKRSLKEDYKKGSQGCISAIEIDNTSCQESDIQTQLGIKLFQAPLSAPVLAQHTLAYIFSAGPNDRASYFRAVLDTQDLEDFRAAVSELSAQIIAPSSKEMTALQTVESMPELSKISGSIRKSKTQADVEKNLSAITAAFLTSLSITQSGQLADQATQIEQELEHRRTLSFPIDLFGRSAFTLWDKKSTALPQWAQGFISERTKIDAETRRLVDLFKAALLLPQATEGHGLCACPLCGSIDALTPARIEAIREQVKATDAYQSAEKIFKQALNSLDASLVALDTMVDSSLPKFAREKPGLRRKRGFTLERIRTLVSDEAVIKSWIDEAQRIIRYGTAYKKEIARAKAYISDIQNSIESWNDEPALVLIIDNLVASQALYAQSNEAYGQVTQALAVPLKSAVDQSVSTKGWEELISIAREPDHLWNGLLQSAAHDKKLKSINAAIKEIEDANGKVSDEKFTEMSVAVKQWWDYLRPDEPAFFDAVQRRGQKTKRTIDIKVGLSASDDRSNPKFRDAVAVFSQSQLHCLGLSMFLARAVQEKTGFIIMDDPVLTSDDDFRPNFERSVIEGLLQNGIQVIVLTQEYSHWKDIGELWRHRNVKQLQISRNDPTKGTEILNSDDDLAAMITRARTYIKSQDAGQRKEGAGKIRDAIERFAKEIIIKSLRASGDSMAAITDYDGKPFDNYRQKAIDLLVIDASHPGKLRTAYSNVTPGSHDDRPPSATQLSTAFGDLVGLKKAYL
ncbi:MAG: AAA family ATPase [Candidatus Omnitrophica bacterium]|jgi:hypothetical protein|nr:AAA family ATPase [Candidatus Omnitrophota bacterium]